MMKFLVFIRKVYVPFRVLPTNGDCRRSFLPFQTSLADLIPVSLFLFVMCLFFEGYIVINSFKYHYISLCIVTLQHEQGFPIILRGVGSLRIIKLNSKSRLLLCFGGYMLNAEFERLLCLFFFQEMK